MRGLRTSGVSASSPNTLHAVALKGKRNFTVGRLQGFARGASPTYLILEKRRPRKADKPKAEVKLVK
jgi:hypothetical protein